MHADTTADAAADVETHRVAAAASMKTLFDADRKLSRAMLIPLLVFSAVALIALGVAAKSVWDAANRWDPLGSYAPQEVTDRAGGATAPTVSLSSGVVHATGRKCNSDSDEIRVQGQRSWVSVDPPGTIVADAAVRQPSPSAAAIRLPGCSEKDYANPIPPTVVDRVITMAREGHPTSVWTITGIETPVREDGTEGVARSWTTVNFTIVCDLPECPRPGG